MRRVGSCALPIASWLSGPRSHGDASKVSLKPSGLIAAESASPSVPAPSPASSPSVSTSMTGGRSGRSRCRLSLSSKWSFMASGNSSAGAMCSTRRCSRIRSCRSLRSGASDRSYTSSKSSQRKDAYSSSSTFCVHVSASSKSARSKHSYGISPPKSLVSSSHSASAMRRTSSSAAEGISALWRRMFSSVYCARQIRPRAPFWSSSRARPCASEGS